MATAITERISGSPARGARDRVTTADRRAWSFRAQSFAARSFIAPMIARAAIGGTITDRVSGA